MSNNLVQTLDDAELEVVCGGSGFITTFTRASALGTYISMLAWAEKFGEGLGNGLYDGIYQ
ncbi:hypothetical protein [Alteromonas sp. AMM-1]|uniref:hypothetical protein n=1 Tax=Alteromonas sp. AMM-1 TaxID=3394233 RepID=UPI0039A69D9D